MRGPRNGQENREMEKITELEMLFDQDNMSGIDGTQLDSGVLLYRTKTIRSGDMLECICYPIVTASNRIRAKRAKISSERQRRVNFEACRRKLVRKAQCNFGSGSIFVTLTYEEQPGEESACRNLDRYLARMRYRAKKNGTQLKYIAVTEISESGRVHHHLLIEGLSRAEAESGWRNGYANARQFQERGEGFTGLVYYMTKKQSTFAIGTQRAAERSFADGRAQDDNGEGLTGTGEDIASEVENVFHKRVRCSKGLIEPRESVADHKISKSKMERIAFEAEENAIGILQKIYPGYECHERPRVRRSEWLPGAFMRAVMWKKRE